MKYGLLFDMDGVLADTEGVNVTATSAMFVELYGVAPPPEAYRPFVGKGAVRYTAGPAEAMGLEIDIDRAVARRAEIFAEMLADAEDISLPGVHRLIHAVRAADDWRVAIATSSPADKAVVALRASKIDVGWFDAYVCGDMVQRKKPDPAIYLMAAERLGIPPERCVGVEDAPPGVEALRAAGMKSIAVTNTFDAPDLADADWVVNSLEEVDVAGLERLLRGGV